MQPSLHFSELIYRCTVCVDYAWCLNACRKPQKPFVAGKLFRGVWMIFESSASEPRPPFAHHSLAQLSSFVHHVACVCARVRVDFARWVILEIQWYGSLYRPLCKLHPIQGQKGQTKVFVFPLCCYSKFILRDIRHITFHRKVHARTNLFWVGRGQKYVIDWTVASVERWKCPMLVLLHVCLQRLSSLSSEISLMIAQTALTGTPFRVLHFCWSATEVIFIPTDRWKWNKKRLLDGIRDMWTYITKAK